MWFIDSQVWAVSESYLVFFFSSRRRHTRLQGDLEFRRVLFRSRPRPAPDGSPCCESDYMGAPRWPPIPASARRAPAKPWRASGTRETSDLALEAILARGVDVALHHPLAELREAEPAIEPVRVLEARVRPQHHARKSLRARPVEHGPDQLLPDAAPTQARVDVETLQLGRLLVLAVNADRADDARGRVADNPERAARRHVMRVEAEQVGHLERRHQQKPVLGEDAADQQHDGGNVDGRGRSRHHHAAAARPGTTILTPG